MMTKLIDCRPSSVSGNSSVVEHNLAMVGVEGSNPFSRSILYKKYTHLGVFLCLLLIYSKQVK